MDELIKVVTASWEEAVAEHIAALHASCKGSSGEGDVPGLLPAMLTPSDLLRSVVMSARHHKSTVVEDHQVGANVCDTFGAFSLFPPSVHKAWLGNFAMDEVIDTMHLFISCPSLSSAGGSPSAAANNKVPYGTGLLAKQSNNAPTPLKSELSSYYYAMATASDRCPPPPNEILLGFESAMASVCYGGVAIAETQDLALIRNEERLLQYVNETRKRMTTTTSRDGDVDQVNEHKSVMTVLSVAEKEDFGVAMGSVRVANSPTRLVPPYKSTIPLATNLCKYYAINRLPVVPHLSTMGLGASHRQCFYAVLLRLGATFSLRQHKSDEESGTRASRDLHDDDGTDLSEVPLSERMAFPSASTPPPPQRVIDELVPSIEACDASGTPSSLSRKMVLLAVTNSIGNSEQYFAFLDEAKITLCAMIEDTDLLLDPSLTIMKRRLYGLPVSSSRAAPASLPSSEETPVEVLLTALPFAIAPIFFITTEMPTAYRLARGLYQQLWRPLHRPSAQMIHSCCLFEHIVGTLAPHCVLHMTNSSVSLSPTALAFGWMATGFADVLRASEVLTVWDRLVAYVSLVTGEALWNSLAISPTTSLRAGNSLTLLPYSWLALVAASLFVLRSPLAVRCKTKQEATAVFADYSSVQIIPLVAHTAKSYCAALGATAPEASRPAMAAKGSKHFGGFTAGQRKKAEDSDEE